MAGSETGRVVFARIGDRIVLGAVIERTPGRRIVVNETAVREPWSDDRVLFVSALRVPLHAVRVAADALQGIRARLDALRESIELEALWEVLADDGTEQTLADLATLALGGPGPDADAAMAWALAADPSWFKGAGPERFLPHSREFVEAERRRRFREAQERDRLERITEALAAARDAGVADPSDAGVRSGIGWLRALAVRGPEDRDGARGVALLERLTGGGTSEPELHAFHLLVALGVFSPDEILGIHRNGFARDFPTEVLEQARELATCPLAESERVGRPVLDIPPGQFGPIAIDDPWTRDVDDALWLEPIDANAWRVHVLITDATARIPMDSSVAREGMGRTATLYLPNGKLPMFPTVLSEEVLSLSEGAPQPMLDFACRVDASGQVDGFDVRPVTATLARRMTYPEVDGLLGRASLADAEDPILSMLRPLHALAQALARRRVEAGAVIVERDEFAVRIRDGEPEVHRLAFDSPARRMVAEFMILACSMAGRFARDHQIPAVYRRQNPPDDKSALDGLVPGSRASTFRLLRMLRRAELTTQPDFHWGLGVVGYTQVTSPLRRFQDFVVHTQIKGFLRDGRPPMGTDELLRVFGDLEAQAEALTQTEREAKRYWLLKVLKRAEGAEVGGEVVAAQGSRALVELDDTGLVLPVPGMGHIAPGTAVRVRIREVDPRRDRVSLGGV